MATIRKHQPKLGIQGSVLAWLDPWAPESSKRTMRTGTGRIYPPQDPTPSPEAFAAVLKEMGAQFYLHHVFPSLEGQEALLEAMEAFDLELCLGNEYGNINGPWVEGTNRYDVPDAAVVEAARSGRLIGLLYDEPAHLQINAAQYRKDGWHPHWGATDGLGLEAASEKVLEAVRSRVEHVRSLLRAHGLDPESAPLIAEHVFPVMFHTHARAGMDPCPKVMKESFQPLQLATAIGAAKEYGRALWICADLWGPDAGSWFTRTSGFPGHSPEEFASALRLGYLMGPTHLFVENVDVLLRFTGERFERTAFGEVWEAFVRGFVPAHPLTWSHREADPDIAIIHSDDGNYGQNERLYGDRGSGPERSESIFHVWHLVSHGTIPAHGSCMHIPGFDFPRHRLRKAVPVEAYPLLQGCNPPLAGAMHPLFYPANNPLVFDEHLRDGELGGAKLVFLAGSRSTERAIGIARAQAEKGALVVAAEWLLPRELRASRRTGEGFWLVTEDLLSDEVREAAAPYLGSPDCWTQRFGDVEVRIRPGDPAGFTLDFEVRRRE